MALATLSIDLEARLAKFEQGLDKAARLAEKNAEQQRAAWNRIGASVTGVAATIASAFAGASIVGFLRNQADALDAFNDSADATGATIENLSALDDIGRRVGTSFDTITGILVKFNGVLADAKPDSPQAEALKAIGLQAQELRQLDPAEALRRTAVALAGFADDGNKARLVQDLFGKSVREAAPFLKDLAEAGELNAKVTADQAAEAEKFNKQLASFQANASDAGRALAMKLIPALSQAFEAYSKFGLLEGFVFPLFGADKIGELRRQADEVDAAIKRTSDSIARMAEQLARDPSDKLLAGRIEKARGRLADLSSQALRVSAELKGAANKILGDPTATPEAGPKKSVGDTTSTGKPKRSEIDESEKIDESVKALARYVAEQQRELDKSLELTEQQKALIQLKELGTTGEIPQVRELVLGLADKVKTLKDEEETRKAIAEEIKRQADAQKALDDAIDGFAGRAADDLKRAQTERLATRIKDAEKLGQKAFSDEELDRIVKGIGGIKDDAEKKFDAIGEFAKQAGRNIQDALGDTVESMLRGKFSGILRSWEDLLYKMAAQAAAIKLGSYLLGDFDKTGQVGGLVGRGFDTVSKWVGSFFHGGGQVGSDSPASTAALPAALWAGAPRYHSGMLASDEFPAILQQGESVLTPAQLRAVSGSGAKVAVQIINNGQPATASATSERQSDGSQLIKVVLNAVADNIAGGGVVARATQSRFALRA